MNNQVLAEYNGYEGTYLLRNYIYGGSERIAMIDYKGVVHYYLKDHLGSNRVVVREDGVKVNTYPRYLAFGELENSSVSVETPFTFTGKPLDDEHNLNLQYFGARYYDPFTGRFIAVDPMKNSYSGQSPYHYTLNNPIKNVDPNGEFVITLGVLTYLGVATIVTAAMSDPVIREGISASVTTIGEGLSSIGQSIGDLIVESRGNGQPSSIGEPNATRSNQPKGKTKTPRKNKVPKIPNQNSKGKPEPQSKDPFPNGPLKEPTGIEIPSSNTLPSGPTIGAGGVVVNPIKNTTKEAKDEDKGTK